VGTGSGDHCRGSAADSVKARQPCRPSAEDRFVQQGDGNADEGPLNEGTGGGFEAEARVDIHCDKVGDGVNAGGKDTEQEAGESC